MKSLAIVVSMTLLMPSAAWAADQTGGGVEKVVVRTTDFRGRPPFERRIERLEPTELARLEARDATVRNYERKRNFRGRPPFARSSARIPTVDFARFEVTDDDAAPRRTRAAFRGRLPHGIGGR